MTGKEIELSLDKYQAFINAAIARFRVTGDSGGDVFSIEEELARLTVSTALLIVVVDDQSEFLRIMNYGAENAGMLAAELLRNGYVSRLAES